MLPTLPPKDRKTHTFPNFAAEALLSIGIICNHGCTAHLFRKEITIGHNGVIILHGHHHHVNDLWTTYSICIIPYKTLISHPSLKTSFIVIPCPHYSTMAQHTSFLHDTLGFPVLFALCDALNKGFLTLIPKIFAKLVRPYPPPSTAILQDHLDQTRRNERRRSALS